MVNFFARCVCATSAVAAVSAATAQRPGRVAEGARGWGGGSAETLGHGRPMQEQGGFAPVAELAEMPSWNEFYANYVRRNQPVILRGHAKRHRAFERWTDEYLARHWGSKDVNAELAKSEERGGAGVAMPFRDFIKEIYLESRKDELYGIIDFDKDKKAKADFDLLEPIRCEEILPQSLTLWMSSGGTSSVLHFDDAENFLMILAGNKTVMLVHQDEAQNLYAPIAKNPGSSPVHQDHVDLESFPNFAKIKWLHGELGPGDTLYIPHTYWHQVNSFGRNLAANLWFGHRQDWQWWDPGNRDEYNGIRFGEDGFGSFDKLKARGPSQVPCTPLATEKDLSKLKFVDEESFKNYIGKKRRKASKNAEL